MRSSTYLNILELRNGCNVNELYHVISEIFTSVDIDKDKQMEQFYEVVNCALKKDEFIGTSSDFHNLSVECAMRNAEDIACDYLEHGLNKYPASMDLLADYIKYGMTCDRTEMCKKYYSDLNAVPKKNWNWRAFRFSIDYLMTEIEKGNNRSEIKQTMLDLANEFRQYIPDDENGYLVQSEIHRMFNEKEQEIAILEDAIEKITRAPKSLLRLADIYYSAGQLERALKMLNRCEVDSLETQMGVSQGYLYYLDGLCQTNILMNELIENTQMDKDIVREKTNKIYDNLRIAKNSLDSSFNLRTDWKFLIRMLETKTKTEYPY